MLDLLADGPVARRCGLPSEGLHDKARADRIPYDLWTSQGYLQTTPGSTVSYEYVAHHLKSVFDQHRVGKIAFDRWNMQHLKPWLLNAGFSEQLIKEKFVPFGQGYQSMSPALRDLESVILEKKLRHGDHPVLKMCMSNAVVERAAAGNRKLSKKRSTGRIDGAIGLTMGCGVAPLRTATKFDPEALIAWESKSIPGMDLIIVGLHGDDIVAEHGIVSTDPTDPKAHRQNRKEYELRLRTGELDRVKRAWEYIYSHGCVGKKSPF